MDRELEQEEIIIPAVTLRGLTIFPDMIIHFDLSKEKSVLAIEAAMMGDQRLFVVTQKELQDEEPDLEQVYPIGTIVNIICCNWALRW